MIAIGVGCRKGCPAEEIVTLVKEALAAMPESCVAAGLFSVAAKIGEPGLAEAAAKLGMPLAFVDAVALRRLSDAATTHSPRVHALYGLSSVAETAALAGAGEDAVLLVTRMATQRATCAIAGPRVARNAKLPP